MSSNKNEKKDQKPSNEESGKNLSKNQNTLDLGAIMQLASSLLKNDLVMKSVTELSNKNLNSVTPETNAADTPENEEMSSIADTPENEQMSSIAEQLEKIANEFSELKAELSNLKEQNNYLTKMVKKLYEYRRR
ncbi:hypothetical protein [Neobacillus bataviensis]|uniref:hypothetical protein n=1 Tax=Neobacillus bataviensis TaxID=220685 RepID=UPI001CBC4F83|nr:hypothetical protein [Neobacillus bataviensis]